MAGIRKLPKDHKSRCSAGHSIPQTAGVQPLRRDTIAHFLERVDSTRKLFFRRHKHYRWKLDAMFEVEVRGIPQQAALLTSQSGLPARGYQRNEFVTNRSLSNWKFQVRGRGGRRGGQKACSLSFSHPEKSFTRPNSRSTLIFDLSL